MQVTPLSEPANTAGIMSDSLCVENKIACLCHS